MNVEIEKLDRPAIEFRDVSISFDDNKVLDRISFSLHRGEMLFFTGVSGSGKSVLLHLAIGLLQPDEGEILVEGLSLSTLTEDELLSVRSRRMGIVFQEDALFSGITVFDNAAYRLREHGLDEAEIEIAVMNVLEFVGLAPDADKTPSELSGGMKRRLELARALVGYPSIMLFDEPAAGLDPITAVQIFDLIIRSRDIHENSSLYVTKELHQIDYLSKHVAIKSLSDDIEVIEAAPDDLPLTRVMLLDQGKIVWEGSVSQFFESDHPSVVLMAHPEHGRTVN